MDCLIARFDGFFPNHQFCVSILDSFEEFVLYVHVLSHVWVGGGRKEAEDNVFHFRVACVFILIYLDGLLVGFAGIRLVKHAENFVQTVIDMSVQQGDLHDDAVVREAFYEGVGFIAFQEIAIVVVGVMVHVNHGRIDIAHSVAKQIDSHHRECVLVFAVFDNVLLSAVLRTEVLSEAQRLRFQPGFLQFDKHQMLVTIVFAYSGGEVNAKH